MPPSVWDVALDEWVDGTPVYAGDSFIDYRARTSFPSARTLTSLSIQDFAGLPRLLRERHVAVFRLGAGRFALVQMPGPEALKQLFIFDEEVFPDSIRDVAPINEELLSVYSMVNKHSETNLINLALASGCLAEALQLDEHRTFPPAATAQSTFDFLFRPTSSLPDVLLEHRNGQIEVDALFLAPLHGRRTLFVLEGKNELNYGGKGSLSKSKLFYASEAVAQGSAERASNRARIPPGVATWRRGGIPRCALC